MEFKVIKLDRKRNNVVVSRRAVLEAIAWAKSAQKLLDDAAGRRDRQGHRQEHHRLRRVRRPRRHRRPAAHHRPGLAPRASTRRKCCTVGEEVTAKVLKFDQEKNRVSLGHQAARRRSVGRPVAPLPAGHAPVRQGHQHHRLRRVRRDRAGHRRPGARLRDGLDQQERRIRPRSCSSATKSKSWSSRSTRTAAASRSA